MQGERGACTAGWRTGRWRVARVRARARARDVAAALERLGVAGRDVRAGQAEHSQGARVGEEGEEGRPGRRAAWPERGPRMACPGGGRGRVSRGQKGPGQARGRGGRKGREGGERRGKRRKRKRKWEKEREKKEKGGERNQERKRERGGERVGADRGRGRPRVVSAACDAQAEGQTGRWDSGRFGYRLGSSGIRRSGGR